MKRQKVLEIPIIQVKPKSINIMKKMITILLAVAAISAIVKLNHDRKQEAKAHQERVKQINDEWVNDYLIPANEISPK